MSNPVLTITSILIAIISVIIHEIAHGVVAFWLGDPTAKQAGRITLNPIPHIDPFFTILVPATLALAGSPVIFGGAKPVPIDPRYFKNPRRGMAIVALAGPVSNLLIASVLYLCLHLIVFQAGTTEPSYFTQTLFLVLAQGILINVVLAAFNMLPIPPLDGGRIVTGLLPVSLARPYSRLERYGLLIVILLLFSGIVDTLLTPVINHTFQLITAI